MERRTRFEFEVVYRNPKPCIPFLQINMIMLFMPYHAQHVNSQMCLHWSHAHLCAVTSMVS